MKDATSLRNRSVSLLLAAVFLLSSLWLPLMRSHASFPEYETTGYYYSELAPKEKEAYRAIAKALTAGGKEFPKSIPVPALTDTEVRRTTQALVWDEPEFFFLNYYLCYCTAASGRTKFIPKYDMTKAEYEKKLKKVRSRVESFLKKAPKEGTDYEKELYVHDHMIEYFSYPSDHTLFPDENDLDDAYRYHTMTSLFLEGLGVCEAYSLAFQYLMAQLGVPARTVGGLGAPVSSKADFGGHAWNLVTLNGKDYLVDVLWDECNSKEEKEDYYSLEPRHVYFNLTADHLQGHWSDYALDQLHASDDNENYYRRNGLSWATYPEMKQKLPGLMAQRFSERNLTVEFQFENAEAYRTARRELFDQKGIVSLIDEANRLLPEDDKFRISDTHYGFSTFNFCNVIVLKLRYVTVDQDGNE